MKKGFALPIMLLCLAGLFIFGLIITNVKSKPINLSQENTDSKIVSDYGFTLTLPSNWKVWEGPSSGSGLIDNVDFQSSIEDGSMLKENGEPYSEEVLNNIKKYQDQVNSWNIKTADYFEISNSKVDYRNRDLAYIGKIASQDLGKIDSLEFLKINRVGIMVSNEPLPDDQIKSNKENVSKRFINVGQKKALFAIAKLENWKITELVRIYYPIESTKLVNSEPMKSLIITTFMKQGDSKSEDDFINLVSNLNISTN